jgi:NADH dehydrogenase
LLITRRHRILINWRNDSNQNLIWAAGVSAIVFEGIPAESYGRGRRMATDAFNKVNGTENIYAGDTCIQLTDGGFPNGHPQVAQVTFSKQIWQKIC